MFALTVYFIMGDCSFVADMIPNLSCVCHSALWVIVMSTEMMCERLGKSARRRASGTEVLLSTRSRRTHTVLLSNFATGADTQANQSVKCLEV